MNPPKQIQINCPYLKGVMFNGQHYNGCIGMKVLITPENVNDYCFGTMCSLPIVGGKV